MPNRTSAALAILGGMGMTPTTANVNLIRAWITCEKESGGDAWQWNNPMNTTEPGFGNLGVVPGNSAGVKIYPTPAQGAAATVATLTNGLYPTLVSALQASNAAQFFGGTGIREIETWGTNPACIQGVYAVLGTPTLPSGTVITPTSTRTTTATGQVITVTPLVSPSPTTVSSGVSTVPTLVASEYPSVPSTTSLPEFTATPAVEQTLPFNQRINASLPQLLSPYQAQPLEQFVAPAPAHTNPWIVAGILATLWYFGNHPGTMGSW